jgi:hypothetical protein
VLTAPCAEVLVIGARGSDAPIRSEVVRSWEDALRGRLGGRSVVAAELGDLDGDGVLDRGGYDAVPAADAAGIDPEARPADGDVAVAVGYDRSRRRGSEELARALTAREAECPRERIVVAGYSLGAVAAGVGLRWLPAAVVDRIDAVMLFGDPTMAPGPWREAPGAQFPSGHGILGRRDPYVPAALVSRTRSWCGWADEACTGDARWFVLKALCDAADELLAPAIEPMCTHGHDDYQRWAVGPAAEWAAGLLRG